MELAVVEPGPLMQNNRLKRRAFIVGPGRRPSASEPSSTPQKKGLNWTSSHSVGYDMRSRVRKFAHVIERLGLAMAGAASGLFVGAHVGSSIEAFTSQGFILIMMLAGAIGFYLGIDTPALAFHGPSGEASRSGSGGRVDAAEFLSAVGTFFAALTAFASVSVIVFREDPHIFWTVMIMLGWVLGVTMQIIAGAISRTRA